MGHNDQLKEHIVFAGSRAISNRLPNEDMTAPFNKDIVVLYQLANLQSNTGDIVRRPSAV